jgi:hypothetical protein
MSTTKDVMGGDHSLRASAATLTLGYAALANR